MAKFEKAMTSSLLDSLLPVYGNPREDIPVWDAEQKMYICDEYTSANGNRYYRGVRLSDNIAVLERIGQWHNWTYLSGLELYVLEEGKPRLVQKREYSKTIRNSDFVRSESQAMLEAYLGEGDTDACERMTDSQRQAWADLLLGACYGEPDPGLMARVDIVLKLSKENRQ